MIRIGSLLTGIFLAGTLFGSAALADAPKEKVKSAVYIVDNFPGPNAIEAFVRDPHTGTLTLKGRYPTGGTGDVSIAATTSHSLVASDRHLYVVNAGSDNISTFFIERDGSLRLVGTTPSQGVQPVSLTISDDLLYVANRGRIAPPIAGGYSGFRVKEDGTLRPLQNSTFPLSPGDIPTEILFNEEGTRLIASRGFGNIVDTFVVDHNGLLSHSDPVANQAGPLGAIFSPIRPHEFFVSLATTTPGLASYRLGGRNGHTQIISTVLDANLVDPCWLSISNDGQRLFASVPALSAIVLYSVDHAGRLQQKSTHVTPGGIASLDVALDSSGQHLYRLRAFDFASGGTIPVVPFIDVLKLTGQDTDGGVAPVQSLALSPDLQFAGPNGMLVVDL